MAVGCVFKAKGILVWTPQKGQGKKVWKARHTQLVSRPTVTMEVDWNPTCGHSSIYFREWGGEGRDWLSTFQALG